MIFFNMNLYNSFKYFTGNKNYSIFCINVEINSNSLFLSPGYTLAIYLLAGGEVLICSSFFFFNIYEKTANKICGAVTQFSFSCRLLLLVHKRKHSFITKITNDKLQ